jgi:hypothetical protein
MRRPLVLLAVLLAGTIAAGCGNADEPASVGETEATYLQLGDLQYQVQLSRQINPADVEDRYYVQGASDSTPTGRDDTWFAVFIRVKNDSDVPATPTSDFAIHDTQGNEYEPVPLDDTNVFRYQPAELAPDAMLPVPGSVAFNSPIRGSLLLFRIKIASFENRPLELVITQPGTDRHAQVALDV